MAGFEDFPLVNPQQQPAAAADPWAQFPMAPTPPSPPAPATPPAGFDAFPEADTTIKEVLRGDRADAQGDAYADTGPNPFGDIAASAASGVRQGFANFLGLPVDILNMAPMLGNLLPGEQGFGPISENPVGGSASLDALFRLGGAVPEYEPETASGRFVERAGQDIGAALVPIGAGGAVARRLGAEGIRQLGPGVGNAVARNLGAPMAAAPRQTAMRELTSGAGAGIGAATANEVFGPDNWIAELLGGVGGAGAAAMGRGIIEHGGTVAAAATGSPKYASRVVNENVANTLASNSDIVARGAADLPPGTALNTDDLVRALQQEADVERAVPGFKATSANRSGDAGLGALEAARARGGNQGRFSDAQRANAQTVERALGEVAPTENAARFSSELGLERNRRLTDADMLAQQAAQQADTAARPLMPQSTPAARGGAIREGLTDAEQAATGRVNAAYDRLRSGTDFADATGSGQGLRDAVDSARATLTETRKGLLPEDTINRVLAIAGDEIPPQPTGVLDASGRPIMGPATPPKPVDLAEVVDLDSELGRLQRAALADPRAERGGRNAAEAIGRIRDQLDGYMQASMTPEQRTALADAKQAAFDRAETFGRQGSPISRATDKYEGGRPRMSDERVASTFSQPSAIDELFAAAPTQETRRAVREEILSRGDFSTSQGAERFMADYSEQMKRFPGLEKEVRDAAAARVGAEGARASADQMAKEIGEGGVGAVAKYLRYGDESAAKAMRQVLTGNPRPADTMDELLAFVGDDPAAVEGAKRAFWDVMEQEGRGSNLATMADDGTMSWVPKKWVEFLQKPEVEAAAQRLYRDDPEQLGRINEIATALRQAGVAPAARTAANPSGTALMQRGAAVGLAEAQAKGYEVARGRVNPLYMVTYLASRMANRAVSRQSAKAYEMALDRALIDPEFAAQLLADNNPANRAALRQMTKGWMGNELSNALVSDLSTQEDDNSIEDALQ